ncbi:MAG: histidine kinase N-terminal 7TM domain-containing protein, partial [Methanobacteriota archaeon]
MISTPLFFILYPISAVITAFLAIYGWKNRNILISHPFMLLMVATTVWTIGDGLITQTTDPTLTYIINTTVYPAVVTVPVAWFLLILIFTGLDQYLTRKNIFLLFIIPALNVILVATNPLHSLFYTAITPENVMGGVFWHFSHGALFPITIIYSYLLILIAFILITSRLFGPTDLYRKQTMILFISCSVPFILNIVYITHPENYPPIDLTPFSFTIVGLLIALGIIRYQLFITVPVANASLFSSMHDGVVATDRQYRIVDLNPAAVKICEWSSSNAIGTSINEVIPAVSSMTNFWNEPKENRREITIRVNQEMSDYEVSDFPLLSRNEIIGRIFTFRDISQRKRMEKELRESQERLQLAIDGTHIGIWEYNFKTLRLDIGKQWAEILGYEYDYSPKNFTWEDIIEHEDIERIRELLLKHLQKVKGIIFSVQLAYHGDLKGVMIFADPLLEKVFFTLVENTVRHSEKATDVWFSYRIDQSGLTLICEDNGVGVNLSDKNKIFSRGFGKNTGFGLFISREILAITGMSIRETG